MSIKISTRFKIFERDRFTCQYCGKKPPEVILHTDHIYPKSKGGQDDELNLITSCRDCNLGKKDKILKNPKKPDIKLEIENLKCCGNCRVKVKECSYEMDIDYCDRWRSDNKDRIDRTL